MATNVLHRPGETFTAEPLRVEESWRVTSSWGVLVAFRLPHERAEKLAEELNNSPINLG